MRCARALTRHSPLRDERVREDMLSEPIGIEEMVARAAGRSRALAARSSLARLLWTAGGGREAVLPCKCLRGCLWHRGLGVLTRKGRNGRDYGEVNFSDGVT